MAAKDLPDLPGNLLVDIKPGSDKDHLRAKLQGLFRRHSRPDTELTGFIAGRSYYPSPPFRRTADDDGLVPVFHVIPLLHGGIECVHVNMYDLSLNDNIKLKKINTPSSFCSPCYPSPPRISPYRSDRETVPTVIKKKRHSNTLPSLSAHP